MGKQRNKFLGNLLRHILNTLSLGYYTWVEKLLHKTTLDATTLVYDQMHLSKRSSKALKFYPTKRHLFQPQKDIHITTQIKSKHQHKHITVHIRTTIIYSFLKYTIRLSNDLNIQIYINFSWQLLLMLPENKVPGKTFK